MASSNPTPRPRPGRHRPDSGNFIVMDGAFEQGPVSQTLSGLQVGGTTTVTFFFAGAQQSGFTSITTGQFAVSLVLKSLVCPKATPWPTNIT